MMKIRFTNILLADGSGNPPFPGELLIAGDRIAEAGSSVTHTGEDVLVDGKGLTLAPGWIDAHGHSDISLLANPAAFGKISQGITTEICGNCGLSAFPLNSNNREHLQDLYAQYHIHLDWHSGNSYRQKLPAGTMRLVPLCGHNTLRAAVAGYESSVDHAYATVQTNVQVFCTLVDPYSLVTSDHMPLLMDFCFE